METLTQPSLTDHAAGMHTLQRGQTQFPRLRRKEAEAEDAPVPEVAVDIWRCLLLHFDMQNTSPATWLTFPTLEDASSTKLPPKITYVTNFRQRSLQV